VFWDLSKTTLEIAFASPTTGPGLLTQSFFCQYLTSTLLFDKLSMQINEVEVSDEASGNLDVSDATKIMLGQRYCPYPYGGSHKQTPFTSVQTPPNAAVVITNNSAATPLNGLGECEINDSIYQSGIGSLPAVTKGQLINRFRTVDWYRMLVLECQGGKGVYKLMPQHPLWNADNGVLLPAVFNTKIELSKARGSNIFEYATTHSQADAEAGYPAFQPTIEPLAHKSACSYSSEVNGSGAIADAKKFPIQYEGRATWQSLCKAQTTPHCSIARLYLSMF